MDIKEGGQKWLKKKSDIVYLMYVPLAESGRT